jgi:polysaccharide biosynthesis protein PslG
MNRRKFGPRHVVLLVVVAFLALAAWGNRNLIRSAVDEALFGLTGEEKLLAQAKGLLDLSAALPRPPLNLAPEAPVKHVNLNPYGVNVFLHEEVEPAKREQTVRLAAEAGFHWLRQEFPWQDIEIHGKGDFEDRRNGPGHSAWDKYDQVVDLAERYGMELIVRVSTPPSWSRAKGDEVGTFAPPDNYEDFGDFVHTLVDRYKGRIKYYQLWNEPNIYPEWGAYPISPEDYTRLLKIGATRAREADPNVVIIAGALASTIELSPAAPPPGNALNDLIYLQRMYDAGAAPYFDIMAMQGYGLWSGPTDRRMHPRVMNYGRPQFVRDLMVKNGDEEKPIWISEMGWNAVPENAPDQRFGRVTPEQQARYTPLAYDRATSEWPWAGVVNVWYFKRATDEWLKAGRPEAYFRLADPDFTLQPVYGSLKAHLTNGEPALQPGMRRPEGWAITEEGRWETIDAPGSPYGTARVANAGAALNFAFVGSALAVDTSCPPDAGCGGQLKVYIEGSEPVTLTANSGVTWVARWLPARERDVTIEVLDGRGGVAALTVRRELPATLLWVALGLIAALALFFVLSRLIWLLRSLRKPTYAPETRFLSPDEPPVYPRRRLWRGVKE